eukprot:COSAG02_NODE_3855_length_6141_cov_16.381000_4_plen_117_part_00
MNAAKAIEAKGNAEAAVQAAKYRAKGANKEVFLAEVQRDIATAIYQNLKDFKVEMPHNYINMDSSAGGGGHASAGGSGKMLSNIDAITALSAVHHSMGIIDRTQRGGWFSGGGSNS